jgi:hypothetical protein
MAPNVRQDCVGRYSNRLGTNVRFDRGVHILRNGMAHFFHTNSNGLERNNIWVD